MTQSKPKQKKQKNQSLIPFLVPASKHSTSSLQKVREFVDEHKLLTNWYEIEYDGWQLPATKEPHCWCGIWKTEGCMNAEGHYRLGKGRTIYVKQFQRSCYRSSCKECYVKWIARQANTATRRIEKYSQKSNIKPIHIIFCIPPAQYNLPVKVLRKWLNNIIKKTHMKGAAVIFHPFKFHENTRTWVYAPHFHLVGFGYRFQIAEAFGKYRWYIKICEERESVFQTFCYLLSHCGIKKGYHALTWLGDLTYSKLKVEKEPKITKCPICNGEFQEIYYEGVFHPVVPPDKPYEGLVDADGWHLVETTPSIDLTNYRFDYASTTDLNETLKGLAICN